MFLSQVRPHLECLAVTRVEVFAAGDMVPVALVAVTVAPVVVVAEKLNTQGMREVNGSDCREVEPTLAYEQEAVRPVVHE